MTEKRIFIREVENPCADCENKGCNVCNCGAIWKESSPRAEDVERMAKAMCRADNRIDDCGHCLTCASKDREAMCRQILQKRSDLNSSYMDKAEAALDALLGGKQ